MALYKCFTHLPTHFASVKRGNYCDFPAWRYICTPVGLPAYVSQEPCPKGIKFLCSPPQSSGNTLYFRCAGRVVLTFTLLDVHIFGVFVKDATLFDFVFVYSTTVAANGALGKSAVVDSFVI